MREVWGGGSYTQTINSFDSNKSWFIAFNNRGRLDVREVQVSKVEEDDYMNISRVIVKIKTLTYKNKLHKFLHIKTYIFVPYEEYMDPKYIKESEFEAKIAYLQIQSINDGVDDLLTSFALEYPDVYLNKIQNYKGSRSYNIPTYEKYLKLLEKKL